MQPVVYRRRCNALSRGEREWRVEEDALVAISRSGSETRIPWTDIQNVRLCADPARFRRWRHVFELQPRRGAKLVIDNASFIGVGRYEERSEAYGLFVRAALERLQTVKPETRALIGETPRGYFFLLLGGLIGLCAAAYGLIAIRTPLDNLPYALAVKLGLILLMLPIFWRLVLGALPRGVGLSEIPERALPPKA